jgi:hypothetical protein
VALSIPVYYSANLIAQAFGFLLGWAYFPPFCVGGFVGGAGLALSFSICDRRLLSWRRVFQAGAIGALAALPFMFWLVSYISHLNGPQDALQPVRLQYGFAMWQAVVGTYFYIVCTRARTPEPFPGGHPQ